MGRAGWCFIIAVVLASSPACRGQGREIPTVIKSGDAAEKFPLDMTGLRVRGDGGATFRSMLASDLKRSGWFSLAAKGGGSIALTGSAEDNGGRLTVLCDVTRVVDGKRYANPSRRGTAAEARSLAHEVADEIVLRVKGVSGIASTRIIMVGSANGKKDIYLCDADGANLTRRTRDQAVCIAPGWSPDGKSVVFTSFRSGFPDVYTLELESRRLTKISGYPGLNSGADISPGGKELVLTLSKDGNPELYVMNMRSQRLTRLTRSKNAEASPSWSPDGKQIAFVSDRTGAPQVYVMDRRSGRQRRLTLQGRENVAPDWGPSGKVAYASRRGGRYQICVIDPETMRGKPLTDGAVDYEDPSWAPDGRHVICSRTEGYKADLYVLDALGDPPVRLTLQPGDWYSPAWSPK